MFAILTTTANKEMSTLGRRMPVIIHRSDEATWLNPEASDANTLYDLMRPYYDSQVLDVWQVGSGVFSAKANSPDLIQEMK